MSFAHPEYLWAILLLPLLALAGWWAARRQRAALARFAGGAGSARRFAGEVDVHRRAVKVLLTQAALLALILTAARPQWGVRLEEVTRGGSDLVLLLDTSLSMAAEDVAPSRLGLARHAADTLLQQTEGDRVALVTFAGRATMACPLTLDHAAVRLFLDAIDVESVPVAGTSLEDALKAALRAFGPVDATSPSRHRAIVLLSDGEDHEGGIDDAEQALEQAGVTVYALGVGTARGAPIPLNDPSGVSSGYKKDAEGKVVTTRLDETVLERLALATGGRYYRATAGQVEVEEIARALSTLDRQEFGAVLRARYEERFQIPLALALLAIGAETLLGDRRRRPESARAGKETNGP